MNYSTRTLGSPTCWTFSKSCPRCKGTLVRAHPRSYEWRVVPPVQLAANHWRVVRPVQLAANHWMVASWGPCKACDGTGKVEVAMLRKLEGKW